MVSGSQYSLDMGLHALKGSSKGNPRTQGYSPKGTHRGCVGVESSSLTTAAEN